MGPEIQQGWQTSALAMHLVVARSDPCPSPLPTSNIVYYLLSRYQWTACVLCKSCEYSSPVWRFLFREPQWITLYNLGLYHQNLESIRYIVAADSICVALQVSEQFCLKPEHANPLDTEPKITQNGHSVPFKVICFDVTGKPLSDCILQHVWHCM